MDAEVAIVGGGPVGHGLALELALRGVTSLVLERGTEPSPIPRGQNLTQRTMEHFRRWGCEAELRAARTIPPDYGIGGMTAYGTLLSPWHHDWLQRELVRPFYAADNERLPQYATEAVLRARLRAFPQATALYGWQAEAVAQDADGVTVDAAPRAGGPARRFRARFVVGCDGARSLVREAMGVGQEREDHDRLMVLLVFRSEELHRLLARFPGKSFYNVLHPALDGYWRFFGRVDLGSTWFFHAPVPAGTTRDNTDFAALLHEAVGAPFAVEMQHVGFWDLRFAIAARYRAGRAFVAGDAAHSHPPYGGYGINTGFEDAANLGWKLAGAIQGWGGPGLLDSYDAERRPVFASTARDFIARSIEQDRAFLRAHDPAGDQAAFAAALDERRQAARAEVGAYEPHYEGSPLIGGPGAPGALGRHDVAARPGHHLAPLPLGDGRDAFDALGLGFTLLAADEAAAAPFRDAAAARGLPLAVAPLRDAGSVARYGASLVLVRPDGFVAWAGETAGEAAAVLARAA